MYAGIKEQMVKMNNELNNLLCLLDGKITYLRMTTDLSSIDKRLVDLIKIQKDIHVLYDLNIVNKGIIKELK